MDDDERQGTGRIRALVDEVDRDAVDLGGELWELIESPLVLPPVVGSAPVLGQLPQVTNLHAVVPPGAGDLLGPARPGQSILEIHDHGLLDVDLERFDCLH